ncbi:MAG: radical SAM protein, partial [Bacteroidota bacterium]|nr:radical SAM protein [Bacteroidota bacterium]
MSDLKKTLYDELKLKVALGIEGVSYTDQVAQKLIDADLLHRYEILNINIHGKRKYDYFPRYIVLKHGFATFGRSEEDSL